MAAFPIRDTEKHTVELSELSARLWTEIGYEDRLAGSGDKLFTDFCIEVLARSGRIAYRVVRLVCVGDSSSGTSLVTGVCVGSDRLLPSAGGS